jgi:[methyl-Co(III) methanol-specific corrinoid protein]:coenzyme M methyltransferase
MKEEMNSKERFLSLLKGEMTDRPVVINPVSLATTESCRNLGIQFNEVHLDADKMAALAAYGSDVIGFDSVMPYFSVVQEASALGAAIGWGDGENMPWQKDAIYTDPDQFVMPEDFLDKPSIRTVLDSIRILKKKLGDKTLIIGKVMGPWTLSMHLYGVENVLMDSMLEPEKLDAFIANFKRISRAFAAAQFDAGADVVTIADHVTSNLVGPDAYVRYVQKAHQELNREFGEGKLILHCCGYTLDRIRHFADGGFSLYHFESANDIGEAFQLAGKMKLTGCINDPITLLQGTTQDVRLEVKKIMDSGIRFLSPECAIPLKTRNENLMEIVKTAAGNGRD